MQTDFKLYKVGMKSHMLCVAEEKILGDISFQEQFFYGKLYK